MSRALFLIAPPLALALLAVAGFAWSASGEVEARMRDRVERTARAAGFDWLRASGNGMRVTLRGVAPDLQARDEAIALAGATGKLVTVRDRMQVAAPAQAAPPQAPEPVGLSILRDAQGATLTGEVPDQAARARIVQGLAGISGGTPPRDFASDAGVPEPEGWRAAETAAISAAGFLLHGRVALSEGRFSVSGVPATDEGRAAIERSAQALAAAGLSVDLALLTPQVTPETLIFDIAKSAAGVNVAACEAPDAPSAAGLIAAIERSFAKGDAPCRMVPGGGDPEWIQAARAGIVALAAGPDGRFLLKGRRATLTAAPDSDPSAFAATTRRLQAALPAGYVLRAEGGRAEIAGRATGAGTVWLRAWLSPDKVMLTGAAPDEATRAAVLSYAAAAFGAVRIQDAVAVAPNAGPPGWRTAALAGIDALSKLDTGEASVADGQIEITGATTNPPGAREAHAAISAAQGWRGESRVTVDLPGRAAGLRLGPTRCAEKLTAIAQATPILFAPASAQIEADSAPALDELAATLARCGRGKIEVGGHTDSQGSAQYNLELSEARATAVRLALLGRGAAPALLVAKGYGQSVPIADNATEEGRARNRRIAFAPIAATAEVRP